VENLLSLMALLAKLWEHRNLIRRKYKTSHSGARIPNSVPIRVQLHVEAQQVILMPIELSDLQDIDFSSPCAGREEIRGILPQRFEMELLSAVILCDPVRQLVVGYKDLKADDFWVRGHMPGFAIFPGVLMCEAAGQLSSFYCSTQGVNEPGIFMLLVAIDEARFVRAVRLGERLVMVGTGVKIHRRLSKFRVFGFVDSEKAFEVLITLAPYPLPTAAVSSNLPDKGIIGPSLGEAISSGLPNGEKKTVEQLTAELAELEKQFPLPDTEAIHADCRWLESRWGSELLAPYRGKHIAVYNGSVIGHSDNALKLELELSRSLRVHPQRLVISYIDPPEF
jgi:3-hydroxyacyl-[acyl-carrier-protein] dehydratase